MPIALESVGHWQCEEDIEKNELTVRNCDYATCQIWGRATWIKHVSLDNMTLTCHIDKQHLHVYKRPLS